MKGQKKRRRGKDADDALRAEVAVRTAFAAVAEAHRLRHSDVEFELVGVIGVGREIAVRVDGRGPGASAGGAVVPAVRYAVGKEVAAPQLAVAGGELAELDAIRKEAPLEAAARPEAALRSGDQFPGTIVALAEGGVDPGELFLLRIGGQAGDYGHLEYGFSVALDGQPRRLASPDFDGVGRHTDCGGGIRGLSESRNRQSAGNEDCGQAPAKQGGHGEILV